MGYKKLENLNDTPWERQPNEPGEHYKLFEIYRDADPKISAAKVGERTGKSGKTTEQISTAYRWLERRDAFIEFQGRVMVDELLRGIPKMRKTHTDIANAMLVKAVLAMQKLPADQLSPRDIATMVDVGSKLERISRGEPTVKTENKHDIAGGVTVTEVVDLSRLSDEELEQLSEITDKLTAD